MKLSRTVWVALLIVALTSQGYFAPQAQETRLSAENLRVAEQLAKSAELSAVLDDLERIADRELEILAGLSPTERKRRQFALKRGVRRLQSQNASAERALRAAGLTSSEVLRLRDSVQRLKAAHAPAFELPYETSSTVLAKALSLAAGARASGKVSNPASGDGQPSECDTLHDNYLHCLNECKAAWLWAAGVAMAAIISALAACAGTGPAVFLCAAIATISYLIALDSAQKAAENCVEECEEWYIAMAAQIDCEEILEDVDLDDWSDDLDEPDLDYCTSDSDCDDDEFCWKGVAGIGRNECRPEKENGETCSRHGQCESNCCKYHFLSNPVSKTCRPASKC